MAELKVDKILPATGSSVSLSESGKTVLIPSGATLDASAATVTGMGAKVDYCSSLKTSPFTASASRGYRTSCSSIARNWRCWSNQFYNRIPVGRSGGGGGGSYIPSGAAGAASDGGGAGGPEGSVGTAGTANTGGGGGGTGNQQPGNPAPTSPQIGGVGGSGIVVIRYKFQ